MFYKRLIPTPILWIGLIVGSIYLLKLIPFNALLQELLPQALYTFLFENTREPVSPTSDLDFYWWSEAYLEQSAITNVSWPGNASSQLLPELKERAFAQEQLLLLNNPNSLLPLQYGKRLRIVGMDSFNVQLAQQFAQQFAPTQALYWEGEATMTNLAAATDTMPLVVLLDPRSATDWWHPLLKMADAFPMVLLQMGHTRSLTGSDRRTAIVHSPGSGPVNLEMAVQALFGAIEVNGSLKHDINRHYVRGSGLYLRKTRLQFALPEEVGLDRATLDRIPAIIDSAIAERAMPGCQLLIAKNGHIVYDQAFGYHTYDQQQAVHTDDLYDLASITKAAATTLAVMRLYEQQALTLDAPVATYLPEFSSNSVGAIPIRYLLAHQSGLQSNLPIINFLGRWKKTMDTRFHDEYAIPFGPDRYMAMDLPEQIKNAMGTAEFGHPSDYVYSDVNYVLLQSIIERITALPLDAFLDQELYEPLGLRHLTYRPLEKYPLEYCVPTAKASHWRGGLLRGYVHDEGAALLGGVAGHAGLFGNAKDLAIIFQLLLNRGEYGGTRYFSPETVELFCAPNGLNYRALGFDRLVGGYSGFLGLGASSKTIGHTGFTGTAVWADPKHQLIFVFLANRVYPQLKAKDPFIENRVRQSVHWQVYRSLSRSIIS